MARYISEFQTHVPAQFTFDAFNQFLASEGYEYTNYKNEPVFKKGKGLATGPTFVKLLISDDLIVHIEAWCKFAVLPGVYAGEMDLEGAVGIAVKKPLKDRIIFLENMLMQAGAVPLAAQPSFVSGVMGTQPYRFAQQNPQVDPMMIQQQQFMQQQQQIQQQQFQAQQMAEQQMQMQQQAWQAQQITELQTSQQNWQPQPMAQNPGVQIVQQPLQQNPQFSQMPQQQAPQTDQMPQQPGPKPGE